MNTPNAVHSRTPPAIRRAPRIAALRWPGLVAVLALASLYPATARHTYELRIAGVGSFMASGASLAVGFRTSPDPWPNDTQGVRRSFGPFVAHKWDWTFFDGGAWRPYHYGSAGFKHHHLVVPVWIPLAGAAMVAGWAFGAHHAARRRDPWACAGCGYGLAGIPAADGSRTCPECGARNPSAARSGGAAPVPAAPSAAAV